MNGKRERPNDLKSSEAKELRWYINSINRSQYIWKMRAKRIKWLVRHCTYLLPCSDRFSSAIRAASSLSEQAAGRFRNALVESDPTNWEKVPYENILIGRFTMRMSAFNRQRYRSTEYAKTVLLMYDRNGTDLCPNADSIAWIVWMLPYRFFLTYTFSWSGSKKRTT